jgi:DNA-binding CsgD family transcriptional regulator
LGYSHSYLQKGGPLFLCSLHHPDDFKIYNETVFPLNINYVKNREITDLRKVIFTVNYRLKRKNGEYCAVRQRSSFVCVASDGTPLVEMSEIMDISEYKTDSKIIHTIENYNNRNYTKLLIKNHFSPNVNPVTLSNRELDVLKCVCNGLCSKQIADQLEISVNTINNHRKNMLKKTHCSNFTELGYQAKSQGLL